MSQPDVLTPFERALADWLAAKAVTWWLRRRRHRSIRLNARHARRRQLKHGARTRARGRRTIAAAARALRSQQLLAAVHHN